MKNPRIISTQIGEEDEKNLSTVKDFLATDEHSHAIRFSLKIAANYIKKKLKLT